MHAIQHLRYIVENLVRRNSDHGVTQTLDVSRPRCVIALRLGMLIAIYLDDEARRDANEIGDERTEWHFSPKLEPAELPVTREAPKPARSVAGQAPQPSRAVYGRAACRRRRLCSGAVGAMRPGDAFLRL